MRAFECPNCGSNVSESDGNEFTFCPYCGTKFDTYDKRIKYHYVKEDVAAIKEADVHMESERNRHEEVMEDKKAKSQEAKWVFMPLIIGFVIAGLYLIVSALAH